MNQLTQTFQVPDRYDTVEFTGVQLADVSTETPGATRWTEIEIFRTEAGQYVIHRTGRSVLYHVHGGPCNTGVTRPARDLDELSLACPRCEPPLPLDLPPDALIDDELDKHTVDVCAAAQVYDTLLLKRGDRTFMSNPARRALTQALEVDPDLVAATSTTRRVS